MTRSVRVSPSRFTQNLSSVNIIIEGIKNDMYIIVVKYPNGNVDYPNGNQFSNTVVITDETGIVNEDGILGATFSKIVNYVPNQSWILGTYEVSVVLKNIFIGRSDFSTVKTTFDIVTNDDFNTPYLTNYPSTIKQMDSFNWRIDNAKPGESLSYTETGPVTRINSDNVMEANLDYDPPTGYIEKSTYFEYAGNYTVTFNFSRSRSISRSITVTPKVFVNFPDTSLENTQVTYSISGGEPNETWNFVATGVEYETASATLDANGNGTFYYTFLEAGSYNITFNFQKSGKVSKSLVVLTSNREGIHGPNTGAITFSEINAEFLIGYDLDQYRNYRWYLKDNPGLGNFTTQNLNFYQFYDKRAIDPVVPGTSYWTNPGYYEFAIPLHRNGVRIQAWGGGGGSGSGVVGGATTVSFPGYYMYAGGGGSSGGGGRRYFSPGGGGGGASGGQVNINGNGGGNDYAVYAAGGTGATAPGPGGGSGGARGTGSYGTHFGQPGQAPGGGGGGFCVMDTSKYPGYGGAGGGGSGAYSETFAPSIAKGTIVAFNVGRGAQDWASRGGNGGVKISWS